MVQPASIARLLPVLPARPPTPPRDSETTEAKSSFFGSIFSKTIFSQTSPSTTPVSSVESIKPASNESPNPAQATSRRSVKWSPSLYEFKEPPKLSADGHPISQPNLRPLASSIERKPRKSILKPYNGPIPPNFTIGTNAKLLPPHAFPNLATMLESVVHQLAGKDRSSKMDAYMSLSGVLKASDNVPDVQALEDKMGLLEQFIQRDLSAKNDSGQPDSVLIIQALTLLSSFLHKSEIARILSADFCASVMDQSIRALEDHSVSKDIVKHLMFLVSQQAFSGKVLNAGRVGRLIKAVHEIEQHVKGRSIVSGRIDVYRSLLRGSPSHMVNNTTWIEDLFQDMLSNLKEIRAAAIAFGIEAADLLGTEVKVSRAVSEFFSRALEENLKYANYYAKRLKTMVEKKLDVATVPQIWSVSILFLRGRPRQFEQWPFFKLWLEILQLCFNTSDLQAKVEANRAWNRFIYTIQPDEKTSLVTIKRLSKPLEIQLRRKGAGNSGQARQSAISSYCTLLYYTLKPYSTSAQIDLFWDEYVTTLLRLLTPTVGQENREVAEHDMASACAILTGLFDLDTPRPWNEKRATQPDLMKASELLALDPKWVRKNAARVFSLLEPLLERMFWQLSDKKSAISILWGAYLKSIASPAAKEIKVSLDTMSCVANMFNMLYKLWSKGPKNIQTRTSGGSSEFLASISHIISTTVSELGLLPFTDKLLSIGQQDTFIVIATPSHRPDKVRGDIKCPLHHLFVLFTTASPGLQYDGGHIKVPGDVSPLNFRRVISDILSPFFDARPSSKTRMNLVGELLKFLSAHPSTSSQYLWQVLADFATSATDMREDAKSDSDNEYPLGAEYREIVNILEVGIEISPVDALPGWKPLFEALVTRVSTDAGDAGRAIAVIEPLTRALLPKLSATDQNACGMSYFQMLIPKTTYPRDRPALDAARRRLWGTANVGPKTTTFDPYSNLYDYVCMCLETMYSSFSEDMSTTYVNLLSAVADLLNKCPPQLFPKTISRVQKGAASWIADEKSHFSSRSSEVSRAVTTLWSTACSRVPPIAAQTGYSGLLNQMRVFICSGLESKHRSMVNMAIETWNTTFGCSDEILEYSPRLRKALLRLRPLTDLNLPFFPVESEEDSTIDLGLPQFAESQNDSFNFGSNSLEEFMIRQRTPQTIDRSPLPQNRYQRVLVESSQPISKKRNREETPESGRRKSTKRNLLPKLRHDDSQIQFEPIASSSPLPERVVDSQLLTDRQRDVKERQKVEAAAMFPDIRSSPRSNVRSAQNLTTLTEALPSLHPESASSPKELERTSEERPTTPIILPAADSDDDFITSSPTPTRSVRSDCEVSVPRPSPSQESSDEQLLDYLMSNDEDIPSSPPELASPDRLAESRIETAVSTDPSAQLDPYAVVYPSKLSTFENAEDQSVKGDLDHDTGQDERAIEFSSSPPKSPYLQPTKEVFVDAMSSPASSDKNTVEDVFLDAISSPELLKNRQNEVRKRTSSPISDLDESSMMRIMDEFDQGFAHSSQQGDGSSNMRTPSPTIKEEWEPPTTLKPLSSDDSDCIIVQMPKGLQKPKGPSSQRYSATNPLRRSHRSTSVTSSRQSSIPETPNTKRASREAAAQKPSPNLRVVIHVPPARSSPRRRATATPLSQSTTSLTVKKRKYDDAANADDESEVPDSQDAQVKDQSTPSGKRRKSRRSQSFTPSETPIEGPESGNDVPRGIKVEGSTQGLEGGVPNASRRPDTSVVEVPVPTKETNYGSTFIDEEEIRTDDTNMELIAETTFDENSFERRRATGMSDESNEKEDVAEGAQGTIDEEMVGGSAILGQPSPKPFVGKLPMLSEIEAETQMSTDQPVEATMKEPTVAEVEVPLPKIIAEKLESIINDLGDAALSREDANTLEDLFIDAKRKLFDAAARGRGRKEGV